MSLSEPAHPTVEQIKTVLADLEAEYRRDLRAIQHIVMAPAQAAAKRQNAELRQRIAARRKKWELYLDARLAEGPGE